MISILVPIYNSEQYIKRCIDSILAQTYMDFELVLLDDGSKDNSGTICDEYAAKDSRVKVIHTSNNGVGIARNRLIDAADGDYLCFVDSDDYIEPKMLEILYHNIVFYEADISLCGTRFVFPQKTQNNSHDINELKVYPKEEAIYELIDNWKITCSPCDKLYKAELFTGIQYPKVSAFEDMMIAFHLFENCGRIVYDGRLLYNYVKTPDSLLRSKFNEGHLVELEARKKMTKIIGATYPYMIPKLEMNELNSKLYVCNRIIVESPELVYVFNRLSAEIKQNYKKIVQSNFVCIKSKVMITVMKINSHLYKFSIRLLKRIIRVNT